MRILRSRTAALLAALASVSSISMAAEDWTRFSICFITSSTDSGGDAVVSASFEPLRWRASQRP
jgi:hypothetical protein